MARSFAIASSQYLLNTSWSELSYPFTFACWAYVTTAGKDDNNEFMSSYYTGGVNPYRTLKRQQDDAASDPSTLRWIERPDGGGNYPCLSTATMSVDAWHHCAGCSAANNDRWVYLDGANKGVSTTTLGAITIDRFAIGSNQGQAVPVYMDGMVSEAAVWSVELTEDEVKMLADGYSPLLIRPHALVAYWPLIRDTDDDLVGGFSLTPVGSPTVGDHPRVLYPTRGFYVPSWLAAGTTESGSFTADATIQHTESDSFTADAAIEVEQSDSFTADAFIDGTNPADPTTFDRWITNTIDFGVIAPLSGNTGQFERWLTDQQHFGVYVEGTEVGYGSFTADAMLQTVESGSFTADATIDATTSQSVTADAAIQAEQTDSFTADATLQRTESDTFTANATIEAEQTGSFTADADIAIGTVEDSYAADAVVQRTEADSFTADAAIQVEQTGSFTADAAIEAEQTDSFTADAVKQRTESDTFAADAAIQAEQTDSFTADARLLRVESDSFNSDGTIQAEQTGSFTADAAIQRTEVDTFTADAAVQAEQTDSFTADATIEAEQTDSFTADAAIEVEGTDSFTADANICRIGKCVWVSPPHDTTMSSTPVLVFTMPASIGNMHFFLELDTANTFDTVDLREYKTNQSQTNWEYWDGDSWEPYPAAGVPNTESGNDCRYTVTDSLSETTWYRRVWSGAVG